MVKCYICEKEVVGGEGYVQGITPGSDTLKLALCPEHDEIENRALIREKWKEMMLEAAARTIKPHRAPRATVTGHEITVRYLDGGVKIVACEGYQVNNENELLVAAVGKEYVFYPLQHVRSFTVRNILLEEVAEPERLDRDGRDEPALEKTMLMTSPGGESETSKGPSRRKTERRTRPETSMRLDDETGAETGRRRRRFFSGSLHSMESIDLKKESRKRPETRKKDGDDNR